MPSHEVEQPNWVGEPPYCMQHSGAGLMGQQKPLSPSPRTSGSLTASGWLVASASLVVSASLFASASTSTRASGKGPAQPLGASGGVHQNGHPFSSIRLSQPG